jgi:hypothetical protein
MEHDAGVNHGNSRSMDGLRIKSWMGDDVETCRASGSKNLVAR